MLTVRGSIVLALASLCTVGLTEQNGNWGTSSALNSAPAATPTCVQVTEYVPVTTSIYGIEPEPTTVYQTIITTSIVTVIETLILTASEELIPYTTTEKITSLILCPTRIVNPTFTAPGPYPTDWTWGCPPDWLCRPSRIDCNFEVGLPDRNFYCSPNECIPAEALPEPLPTWDTTYYGNSTPITDPNLSINAIDSYFNVAPPDFGLTYEIFVVEEVFTSYSTLVIQPTATVEPRQAQTSVPGACYPWCNNCLLEAQSVGKTPALCKPGSAFEVSLNQCEQCIAVHKTDNGGDFVQIAPQFQQFLDYCASLTIAPTITATIIATATPAAVTVLTSTTQVPGSTSTSSTVKTISASTITINETSIYSSYTTSSYTSVVPVISIGVTEATLSGTELSSVTIVVPLGDNVTSTLYGSLLSNATVVLPESYTTTSNYTTIIATSGVFEVTSVFTSTFTSNLTSTSTSTSVTSTTTSSSSGKSVAAGSTTSPAAPSNSQSSDSRSLQPLKSLNWLAVMGCALPALL